MTSVSETGSSSANSNMYIPLGIDATSCHHVEVGSSESTLNGPPLRCMVALPVQVAVWVSHVHQEGCTERIIFLPGQ